MDNCKNQTLKVATVNHSEFQTKKIGDKWLGVGGKDFEMLKILSDKMGFRYDLVSPADQQWGSCDDAGNCTGMIGMVARMEADIATAMTPTEARAKYVEFSTSYYQDVITFVTTKPDPKLEKRVFFAKPFELQVWIAVTGFLIIFITLTKILERLKLLSPKWFRVNNLIAILLRQDVSLEMATKESRRLIILAFLLVSFGCAAKMYECVLTSETSLTSTSRPLDTLEDMVDAIKNKGYVIGADFGTSFYYQVMTSELAYLKIFANSMKGFETHRTFEEGLMRTYTSDYATIGPGELLRKTALRAGIDMSKLHFASDYLFIDPFALAYGKNFRCKDALDRWLEALVGSNLMSRWEMEINWKMNKVTVSDGPNQEYIDFNDLKLVLLGLLIGYSLSSAILILENYKGVNPIFKMTEIKSLSFYNIK